MSIILSKSISMAKVKKLIFRGGFTPEIVYVSGFIVFLVHVVLMHQKSFRTTKYVDCIFLLLLLSLRLLFQLLVILLLRLLLLLLRFLLLLLCLHLLRLSSPPPPLLIFIILLALLLLCLSKHLFPM